MAGLLKEKNSLQSAFFLKFLYASIHIQAPQKTNQKSY